MLTSLLMPKYAWYVLITCAIFIISGIVSLFRGFHAKGRKRETLLAVGNAVIALFGAILSAFVADFMRPADPELVRAQLKEARTETATMLGLLPPVLSSPSECLDHWFLQGEIWHYSLTRMAGAPVWQVGHPAFSRATGRIVGHGVWIDTVGGGRVPYDIEVGCRGKRGIWIFTQSGVMDTIPTVEVYPELPESVQVQVVGYGIDQTWDEHEVLAPTMISREALHGSESLGPIKDSVLNKRLTKLWEESYAHHTRMVHECTICVTLSGIR